jgi:hypothetical protein
MKKTFLAVAVFAIMSGVRARDARALNYVHFSGGPMKNLYVDLIFWGTNFNAGDRSAVMQNVIDVANWLNGVNQPPIGMEPAIHYYGPSSIAPGQWIADFTPIPTLFNPLDDSSFQAIVSAAQRGDFGAAFDYNTNVATPSGLPAGSNRLALVITKGTNDYCISAHRAAGCLDVWGYHDSMSGNPYGAVMSEHIWPILSHEILEAMSDPYVGNGWVTDGVIPFTWGDEIADECETQSGGSEFAWLTINAPYTMSGVNTQSSSCMQYIPEAHAPLAATFGYGGMGTVPLYLFFVDRNGHLKNEYWGDAGQAATGPNDLGQPSSGVRAVGKPSVVFSNNTLYVFVKGSDNVLWMYSNNTWTYLGGSIYGDPSAVVWTYSGATWIHVAALGLDSYVWLYGLRLGVPQGWGQIYTGGTLFAGPPNLVSQGADSLDVFATGEDGQMKWVKFRSGSWFAPITVAHDNAIPITSKPAVTRINGTTNGLDLIATSSLAANTTGLWQTSYEGSSWSSFVDGEFNITPEAKNYGFEGTPAVVSTTAHRVDVFSVARSGKLWWFWNGNQPGNSQWHTKNTFGASVPPALVDSGATGDPVAVSRGAGKMEVFYRTDDGRLAHMTTTNSGTSWTTETVLPAYSIQ